MKENGRRSPPVLKGFALLQRSIITLTAFGRSLFSFTNAGNRALAVRIPMGLAEKINISEKEILHIKVIKQLFFFYIYNHQNRL